VSEQNVEFHRQAVKAVNARDIDALIALMDPSVEYHSSVAGALYRGLDGVRSWHRELEEVWGGGFRVEPEAYFDLGAHTLAFFVSRGRGSQSGVEVAMPQAQAIKWRDGLAVYLKVYGHREEALKDLGVSDDALEPIAP